MFPQLLAGVDDKRTITISAPGYRPVVGRVESVQPCTDFQLKELPRVRPISVELVPVATPCLISHLAGDIRLSTTVMEG